MTPSFAVPRRRRKVERGDGAAGGGEPGGGGKKLGREFGAQAGVERGTVTKSMQTVDMSNSLFFFDHDNGFRCFCVWLVSTLACTLNSALLCWWLRLLGWRRLANDGNTWLGAGFTLVAVVRFKRRWFFRRVYHPLDVLAFVGSLPTQRRQFNNAGEQELV